MTAPASSPVPGPRPVPKPGPAGSGWPARLSAALSARPGRIVLPHHSPAGEEASYSYPTEDDAVVLLPGAAVVVQLLPAEAGRVLGHYAAYHWHHEQGAVRTVVPNPLARIRHKQSVLYTKLGRRIGTQGVVVHYDEVDVSAVERDPGHPLVALSALDSWLAGLAQGRRPTAGPEELRRRLHSRRTRNWPENGYHRGRVLTYQDTWVVHEGVHSDPAGRDQRVALVIGPNDTKTRYGARRDHDVAHRSASGPVLAPFTVENGTRLVVPLPLPAGPDLGALLHTGLAAHEALRHSLALLRTIADRHARYVVHQAIRPELVFPDEDGRTVTLIGAAYARIGGQGGGTDLLRSAVRDAHVAPEIREGAERTAPQAADLWSWATVTLALLLGPGAGEHPPADLPRLPADVPGVWRRALERCLGRQGERPTATALLALLDGSAVVPAAASGEPAAPVAAAATASPAAPAAAVAPASPVAPSRAGNQPRPPAVVSRRRAGHASISSVRTRRSRSGRSPTSWPRASTRRTP